MSDNDTTGAAAPRRRSRPGGRAAQVVAAVHEATLALLQERGFDAMEIPEIAERAGVNKTSIYRRWPGKVELVLDVAMAQMRSDVPVPDTGSLAGDLSALLDTIAVTLATPFVAGLLRALFSRGDQDEAVRAARDAFWDVRFGLSAQLVKRGIVRGELPVGTDPRRFLELAAAPLFFRTLVTGEAITAADTAALAQRAITAFQVR